MKHFLFLALAFFLFTQVKAQITERERPQEWDNLVNGSRFLDLFEPIPAIGELRKAMVLPIAAEVDWERGP